jgi:lysophospholipase L1-like esterase
MSLGPYGNCNGYVLNSVGLRNPEYRIGRERGIRRVVLLGDSFLVEADGSADPDHFVTRLRRALDAERRTEVVNLGVSGVGIRFYRRMLEVEGARLAPDLAVVVLFVGNDLTDEPVSIMDFPWKDRLAVRFRTVLLVRNLLRLRAYAASRDGAHPPRGKGDPAFAGTFRPELRVPAGPLMTPEGFEAMEMERAALFMDPWPTAISRQWGAAREDLKAMAALGRKGGFRLMVVLVPDQVQVDDGLRRRIESAFAGVKFDFTAPQSGLAEACRADGVAVVDLLPAFRGAAPETGELYAPLDTHWNPAGQDLAARRVASAIAALR